MFNRVGGMLKGEFQDLTRTQGGDMWSPMIDC